MAFAVLYRQATISLLPAIMYSPLSPGGNRPSAQVDKSKEEDEEDETESSSEEETDSDEEEDKGKKGTYIVQIYRPATSNGL